MRPLIGCGPLPICHLLWGCAKSWAAPLVRDAKTGTNTLLSNPKFLDGLRHAADLGFSFDLQLLPELMAAAGDVFDLVPDLPVALCHAGSPL